MIKNFVVILTGVIFLTSPIYVAAQAVTATSANPSLIAALTQLVQLLEQELQQLLTTQQNKTLSIPAPLTATPMNGPAPLTISGNSTQPPATPSISITNISSTTITIQYSNLSNTAQGATSPDSLWIQNTTLSKPSLEMALGGAAAGMAMFTLPAGTMAGDYTITPVGVPIQPSIGGSGPGQVSYGVSASFSVSASGVVTVGNNVTIPPSATITSPSAQSSGNFSVFGTAYNCSAVIVTLISTGSNGGAYSGGTDWNTIGGYLQGTPYATTAAGNILHSYTAPVTNTDQFSTYFTNISPGIYSVLVHNNDHAQYALLARDTLLVSSH